MLRDAALTVLELNIELSEEGLFIQDPDAWNVLFDGCNPIFIDVCSVRAFDNLTGWLSSWPAYEHFCRHFLYPLYLIADGHERLVRSLLRDWHPGVTPSEFSALHGQPKKVWGPAFSRRAQDAVASSIGICRNRYDRWHEGLRRSPATRSRANRWLRMRGKRSFKASGRKSNALTCHIQASQTG